ncbi:MAG: type III secretion system chaperone [Ramlibacter sp.]
MVTLESAHSLLAAYSQHAGVPGLKFSADGCARLLFEDAVAIDLEVDPGGDRIQIYSVLGPVPAGPREQLYRRLLEGNLFGSQTGGAALSIDPVQDEVLLCRPYGLDADDAEHLAKVLEEFAGAAAHWRKLLGGGELTAGAGDTAAGSWQDSFLRG